MNKEERDRMNEENKVKDHCPICGYQFDEVLPVNVCPTRHYGEQEFTPEQLIGCYDDYEWCA
jgi:hypothetical protein